MESVEEDESGAGCNVCMLDLRTERGWIGSKIYNYKYLCTWSMPWTEGGVLPPQFFGKDEKLPLFLSLFLGLQHALAMLIGIATSGGYLIANDACLPFRRDSEMCERMPWMISVAWLTSGLLTIIQVFRVKIAGTGYFLGTGLISVMGTSFTFLPIVRTMVQEAINEARLGPNSWPTCETFNGTAIFTGSCCSRGLGPTDCRGAGAQGYGRFLGTVLVAALFEIVIAFIPARYMRRMFPPVVTGAAVMLIGGGLIGSAIKYMGGGVFCAENMESRAAAGVSTLPSESARLEAGDLQYGNRFLTGSGGFGTVGPQLCAVENGDVVLGFGDRRYVGLASSVIVFAIFLQVFGSPFFKSTFLFWALAFGTIVASAGYDIDGDGNKETFFRQGFLSGPNEADDITFLWVEGTFSLRFAPEYFIPIVIGFLISTAESVGDVDLTARFSGITDADEISSRVQGGLLADGLNSLLAALFGSPPNTTFSQNNGLIALTRCASRSVGFSCAFWLIMFGIFGKFGALFASIPICVIGGLVLICWSSVFVSGMYMATLDFTRRNQFILTIALGFGLGVAMEGQIFDFPGPHTFYRQVLAFDFGFWPTREVCEGYSGVGGGNVGTGINITNSTTPSPSYQFCPNLNGPCCAQWDERARTWRTAVITVLKTPYGIGFLIAFILNAIMPFDKDEKYLEMFDSANNPTEMRLAGKKKPAMSVSKTTASA
jgi:NCS2 family nucleobase:cation symporter-2